MWIVFLRVKEDKKISLQCALRRAYVPQKYEMHFSLLSEAITVPT